MGTKTSIVLAVAASVIAMPAVATGHPALWQAGDQTESTDREMEVRSVTQDHSEDEAAHFISFDVRTFEDFDNSRLDDAAAEHWTLMIAFDLDAKRDFDRMLYVDAEPDASGGYTLYGTVTGGPQRYDDEEEGPWLPMRRVLGHVRVQRPTTDSVRVSFPESTLRKGGVDRFSWQVRTVWRVRACPCVSYAFDFAPRQRMRRGHS